MPAKRGIKYRDTKERNLSKKQSGITSRIIDIELKKDMKANKKEPTDGDSRNYIIKLMEENIKNGKTEEEAIEIAMNDIVAERFNYLEKNGLNKKECFRNWIRGYLKTKERKMPDFLIR